MQPRQLFPETLLHPREVFFIVDCQRQHKNAAKLLDIWLWVRVRTSLPRNVTIAIAYEEVESVSAQCTLPSYIPLIGLAKLSRLISTSSESEDTGLTG